MASASHFVLWHLTPGGATIQFTAHGVVQSGSESQLGFELGALRTRIPGAMSLNLAGDFSKIFMA